MASRIYNRNRNVTKRPDGTPIMIRWGKVAFPLPNIGEFVTIQDDRIARIIVTQFEGLDLVAPQPTLPPAEKPSKEILMAMGGKRVEVQQPATPAKKVEVVVEEPVLQEITTPAADEALEKATSRVGRPKKESDK